MKKIVLITTGQPSGNPRIVKEADALQSAGYEVTVLYCFFIRWSSEKDKVLLQKVSWKYKLAGGSPEQNKWVYWLTRLRCKLAGILIQYLGHYYLLAERTQARAYDELLREAKKIKADWYIGHNLGALPVAVKAAQYHNAKAGFDFEDYHRGELAPGEKTVLKRIIHLESSYLPSLQYVSTASELITDVTVKNHPGFKNPVITIRNCFPISQQPAYHERDNDTTLQLFWFSQTIGVNRGLEVLISALNILNDPRVHLTLAGRCDEDMLQYIRNNAGQTMDNIHFAGIIQPEELPSFAAVFDVGMAIELAVPVNRDICLTNKIFTYLLAGNAVILSATAMQMAFNEMYKVGASFEVNNANELAERIKEYQQPERLKAQRLHNYELAKRELNWEKESVRLTDLLDKF